MLCSLYLTVFPEVTAGVFPTASLDGSRTQFQYQIGGAVPVGKRNQVAFHSALRLKFDAISKAVCPALVFAFKLVPFPLSVARTESCSEIRHLQVYLPAPTQGV